MAEPISTSDRRRALWSHVRALIVIVGVIPAVGLVILGIGKWTTPSQEDRDFAATDNIVRKASDTPSTLTFFRHQLVISDGDWRLVTLEFDEQNLFGAMIRRKGCVVFQWTSDNTYRWNPFPTPVLPCDIELQSRDDLRFLIDGQKELILRRDRVNADANH